MTTKRLLLIAGLAGAALTAATSAQAARYTCDKATPCIVQTDELKNHRVVLKFSGQGLKYEFYKLTVRLHGSSTPVKEMQLRGGKSGRIRLDLKKAGDYEISLAGCEKAKKGAAPVCKPSSEHVRLNLR